MKAFFIRVSIVILISIIGYTLFFSIFKIKNESIGIVEDLRNGQIVRIFNDDINFIWQGSCPWWFSVYEISANRFSNFDLKISFPQLMKLDGEQYKINIPICIQYRIDTTAMFDISLMKDNCNNLEKLMMKSLHNQFAKELSKYLSNSYNRKTIEKNINIIADSVNEKIVNELKLLGLQVMAFKTGNIFLPSIKSYYNGIAHLNDLLKIEKENINMLKELKYKIERKKIQDRYYYADLTEISKIIKQNPNILKYIYIDKITGKLELVDSSDSVSIMKMLKTEQKVQDERIGEIDNLR